MTAKLILPIGVPGCGKSTLAEDLKIKYGDDLVIVSPDSIREEINNDASDQSNQESVFEKADRITIAALNAGKVVFLDATNAHKTWRDGLLKKLEEKVSADFTKTAYFFETDLETSLDRNEKRERFVPEEVIENMYSQMISKDHVPGKEFNEIKIIDKDGIIKDVADFEKWFTESYVPKNEKWAAYLDEGKIEMNTEYKDLYNNISVLESKLSTIENKDELEKEISEKKEELSLIRDDLNDYKNTFEDYWKDKWPEKKISEEDKTLKNQNEFKIN